MRQFYYYFPGRADAPDAVRECGLAGRLPRYGVRQWTAGPAGAGPGACVMRESETIEYCGAQQTWLDCGAFWIGFENARKPRACDLVRPLILEGYAAELLDYPGDGIETYGWVIPRVKKYNPAKLEWEIAFPHTLRMAVESGRCLVVQSVALEYQPLEAIGTRLVQALCSGDEWSIDDLFSICVTLLERNYYVGGPEIGLLGLLDETCGLNIARIAVDAPAIRAHMALVESQGLSVPDVHID